VREFAFELALCARLETETAAIVSRQLGAGVRKPGGRVVDTVIVEPGTAFDARAAITPESIPLEAIESDVGPGRFRPASRAIEGPPERVDRIIERAVEVGFFECERRNGREYVRQVARYPDWVDRIVGIENKPDLGRPGDLETQLRIDASLGVLDAVVLATESYVTGAHRNRIPDPVGIWRFDPETGDREVLREPNTLPPDEAGVELLDRRPGRADVRIVAPAEKARARTRIAERAYGKGWRTYSFPACDRVDPDDQARPHCAWKDRSVDPAVECSPDCPGHVEAPVPSVDLDAARAKRQLWEPSPDGRVRRQSGLGQFAEDEH
jgi:hypothetical protein